MTPELRKQIEEVLVKAEKARHPFGVDGPAVEEIKKPFYVQIGITTAEYAFHATIQPDFIQKLCQIALASEELRKGLQKYVDMGTWKEKEVIENFCLDECPRDCQDHNVKMIRKSRIAVNTEIAKNALDAFEAAIKDE